MLTLSRLMMAATALTWSRTKEYTSYLGVSEGELDSLIDVATRVLGLMNRVPGETIAAKAPPIHEMASGTDDHAKVALDSLLNLADRYVVRPDGHAEAFAWYKFTVWFPKAQADLALALSQATADAIADAVSAFTTRMAQFDLPEPDEASPDGIAQSLYEGMVRTRYLRRMCARIAGTLEPGSVSSFEEWVSEREGAKLRLLA